MTADYAFTVHRLPAPANGRSTYVIGAPAGISLESIWWANRFLQVIESEGAALNTVRNYATGLRWYVTWLASENLRWDQTNRGLLARFSESLMQTVEGRGGGPPAPETINLYLAAVSSALMFSAFELEDPKFMEAMKAPSRSGRGGHKPMLTSYAPNSSRAVHGRRKTVKKRPQELDDEIIQVFCAVLPAIMPLRDQLFLRATYDSGARPGQLLSAKHDGVKVSSDAVTIEIDQRLDERDGCRHDVAAKSVGQLRLTAATRDLYWAYRENEVPADEFRFPLTEWLFINVAGGVIGSQMSPDTAASIRAKASKLVSEELGRPVNLTFRAFRHRLAYDLKRGEANAHAIQKVLTHGAISSQDIYGHHLTAEEWSDVNSVLNDVRSETNG